MLALCSDSDFFGEFVYLFLQDNGNKLPKASIWHYLHFLQPWLQSFYVLIKFYKWLGSAEVIEISDCEF